MNAPPRRADVDVESTWNLQELFRSVDEWRAELADIERSVATVTTHQGRLAEGSGTLLACLDARDTLQARLQRAYTFASLRNSEDGTDPARQSDFSAAAGALARVNAATAFVDSEILALPEGTVQRWQHEEPLLQVHRRELEDLAEVRPHMLAPDSERLLAGLSEVLGAPYMVYNRSKMSDLRFEPFTDGAGASHANSFNQYEWEHEPSPDPTLRRAAWRSFCDGLSRHRNTYAATFATEIKKNIVLAKARGYENAEHFLLQSHKVPFELYTNVLDTIQSELAPHMRRYARLRKRVLGLDRLLYCDLKSPLDAGFQPAITFDEARDLILAALAPMGAEYVAMLRTAFERRWIDRAGNVGKSSGAFCASPYGVHPFILVTWADSMRDAFVLAHELGHAGHFLLAQHSQRFCNTRPAMPFIEAPSTMHEVLLARHILASAGDSRMRRWVLMQVLGTYKHNFITHLLEAELQRQVYRFAESGGGITASLLDERKRAILSNFWGDTVEIDGDAALTWMRQPHYYLGLYPYTYSVGLVASTALAQRAEHEGLGLLADWQDVLRAGGTLRPLELAKKVGIDLSSPEPIRQAGAYVGRLVEELEASF
jgi:oligoendopeptidase F